MSIRKRNEFLEGDDSDADFGNGSDSDEDEGRAAIGGHVSKRRKTGPDSEFSSDDEVQDEAADVTRSENKLTFQSTDNRFNVQNFNDDEEEDTREAGPEDDDGIARSNHGKSTTISKSSATRQAERAQKAVRKSGVIYVSRVPPFMKPHTLKHMLEPHARKGLGRVFLTPEDHSSHSKRVKNGGNKKKSFTDGWVEFNSKTEAKIAAETLNGNIIGGKKGGFYHDDLWNIKYLKGFKWSHLTEQMANENAERAARMREEIRRTRKENKAFVEDLEKGKMLEGMENKRRMKGDNNIDGVVGAGRTRKIAREFKQNKVQAPASNKGNERAPAQAAGVLSKIF